MPHPRRVVTAADDLGGATLRPHVAARSQQRRAAALRDAGYEIVDEPTPGFTRAIGAVVRDADARSFADFMLPIIEKRRRRRHPRRGALQARERAGPSTPIAYLKALAERTRLIREWTLFLDAYAAGAGAGLHRSAVYAQGFDIESAARTAALWRESRDADGGAGARACRRMAVPTGVADGLPVGVQIIGPRFREDLCLAAAEAIEARAPRDHADRSAMW